MKLSNKTASMTTVAIILLMAASVTLMFNIPQVKAQSTHGGKPGEVTGGPLPAGVTPSLTLETLPYISVRPNPVGIGQTILVNMWVQPPLHVDRAHTGYTVTFTKPDGTKAVVGPVNSFTADTTYWFEYVVDQVGTWKYKFSFSGDYYPEGRYSQGVLVTTGGTLLDDVYYTPSETPEIELVVQQEQVRSWPGSALPTDYWTRPISPENREWWQISGNDPYLGAGGGPTWPAETNTYSNNYDFVPYVQGPESSHIVWKKQGSLAGLFGGAYGLQSAIVDNTGGRNTFIGSGGPGSRGNPQIVLMGRCYWTTVKPMLTLVNGTYRTLPTNVWECFDLRTGEVYWDITDVTAPTIIHYEPEGEAVPGAVYRVGSSINLVALSGGRLIRYNPDNGQVISNLSIPVSSGTLYCDPYVLSVQNLGGSAGYRLINWTIGGTSSNFASRIVSNISYPFSSVGSADYESMIAVTTQSISSNATGVGIGTRLIGVNLLTGAILWNVTTETATGTQGSFSGSTGIADHGKYALRLNDGLWHCWDLRTGQVAWTSELTSYPWGIFGEYDVHSAYGLLYYTQYDGVQAWDWDNGKLVWSFHAPSNPYEVPYLSQYSWGTGAVIADGKIYAYNCEHSPSAPVTRGWRSFCINATSGEGIWNITGTMCPGLVADGYLTAADEYLGTLFAFGKGKTTTTVQGPLTAVPKGQGIVIQGTVLDISPAQENTPCVSKETMTTQMEYLHMQHPIDGIWHNETITGVPVSITAVGSDGSFVDLGTVTSDGYYGTFTKTWNPDKEGNYKIIAAFAGDDSYGSSGASTSVSVGPAPATINIPEQATPPDYTLTIIGTGIAVIISVAIAVLLLRKR